MAKLLLIHNSDTLFKTLKPPDNRRPLFYWYTDRFVSHIGTQQYLYIFVVNPKEDNVQLRARSNNRDFDSLHRDFLHYKDYSEGKYPELKYGESGIAMSFSELTPAVILMARSYGSGKNEWLQTKYEILTPHRPFSKRIINLIDEPYNSLHDYKPRKFIDIPELVDLLPSAHDILPIKSMEPDSDGVYHYDDWLPMITHGEGTWL